MRDINFVLVTGGAGYVGSTLVNDLADSGYKVRTIDSLFFEKNGIADVFEKKSIDFIHGDIRDTKILDEALNDIDCVIHLAAITGPLCDVAPKATKQINETATTELIKLCNKKNVNRFIFASTCSNYGSNQEIVNEETPLMSLSLYSETKVKMESLVINSKKDDFETCVLRLSTVFGISPQMRFDLLLQEIIKEATTTNKIKIFGPEFWRPLIHVKDASNAFLTAIESTSNLISGETYNVGADEQNYKKLRLAELVKEFLPEIEIEILKLKKDPRNYRVSFKKIQEKLNFKIKYSANDGISELLKEINEGNLNPLQTDYNTRSNLAKKIPVLEN